MRERWGFGALDKLVPDGQTDRQTDGQSDSLSSWRSQKYTELVCVSVYVFVFLLDLFPDPYIQSCSSNQTIDTPS